jgi:hypothetical protein
MMTQIEKIRKHLNGGNSLTAAQARSRFGVQNLRARVYDLRQEGMVIGTEPYTRKDGTVACKYSLKTAKTRKG